jgi:hypothetical protein
VKIQSEEVGCMLSRMKHYDGEGKHDAAVCGWQGKWLSSCMLYCRISYVSYAYLMSLRHSTVLKHTNDFPFALLSDDVFSLPESSNIKAVPTILPCVSRTVQYYNDTA